MIGGRRGGGWSMHEMLRTPRNDKLTGQAKCTWLGRRQPYQINDLSTAHAVDERDVLVAVLVLACQLNLSSRERLSHP